MASGVDFGIQGQGASGFTGSDVRIGGLGLAV